MNTRVLSALASCLLCATAGLATDRSPETFVNWESPHVHPLDATPNGRKLLAVNTADNRLEVFSTTGTSLTLLASVPVGLDPVSVRARSNSEAWVVNQISDSVSIVNLTTYNVTATLKTQDEPADVVFAGNPQKAFVTCAQPSTLMVFNAGNIKIPATVVNLLGEEPRALAVSADRTKVYAAFFDSGNETTILGSHGQGSVVSDVTGPYGGQNPPPNVGSSFVPPVNPAIPFPPPTVGLIVGKNASGQWHDDNTGDWSDFVNGSRALDTGRNVGWDMLDNDVAVIDVASLGVTYMTGMMNLCMAIATHPGDGKVSVVGLEATNVTRFVPILQGRFIRVNMAMGSTSAPNAPSIVDLNPHLDYSDAQIAQQRDPVTASQELRDESLGDPRAIVWNGAGSTGYVAGMGSNNVVVIDSTGARVATVPVAEGPTGLALVGTKLYVLSKFAATITTITTSDNQVTSTAALFDPTPDAIKIGRKELYDTHKTSGLGQIACASCHVDAQTDRIAWDLGDPTGTAVEFEPNMCNLGLSNSCSKAFHPMKGPMMTQTLQDIIGKEPLHWRGDKRGLEDFNGAFTALQGDDEALGTLEMQQFEDFVATIHYPPNPYRNFDNTLATNVPLTGQFASGRLAGHGGLLRGAPLPNGDAAEGYRAFRDDPQHIAGPQGTNPQETTCRMCHTLPVGTGADVHFVGDKNLFPQPGAGVYEDNLPLGPNGEHHLMMTELTFGANLRTFKPAQLRNTYKKLGFQRSIGVSTTGFGFFNDGGEELETFIGRFPHMNTDQKVANIIAFLMSFTGSDLDTGAYDNLVAPPGPSSLDTPAAVGAQITVTGANKNDPRIITKLNDMMGLADQGKVGLVAKGLRGGVQRGYTYLGGGVYQSDHAGETISATSLRLASATGSEITMTVVPFGSETRIGIDRDLDGTYDGDE